MRAWLPVALAVSFLLPGCPDLLSDWRITGSGPIDASVDASVSDAGIPSSDSASEDRGGPPGSGGRSSSEASLGASGGLPASSNAGGSSPDGFAGAVAGGVSGSGGSSSGKDGGPDSGSCTDDLSNILGGDFHISFEVLGASSGGPLLEQRSDCDPYSEHWLIAEQDTGDIIVQLSDGDYANLQSVAVITDGAWHHIVVARISGTLSIAIDGKLDNSIANTKSLRTLSRLQVGRSVCTMAFTGQIKNVCITRQ